MDYVSLLLAGNGNSVWYAVRVTTLPSVFSVPSFSGANSSLLVASIPQKRVHRFPYSAHLSCIPVQHVYALIEAFTLQYNVLSSSLNLTLITHYYNPTAIMKLLLIKNRNCVNHLKHVIKGEHSRIYVGLCVRAEMRTSRVCIWIFCKSLPMNCPKIVTLCWMFVKQLQLHCCFITILWCRLS